MRTVSILAIIIALFATMAATVIIPDSEGTPISSTNDDKYIITYYGEIEDNVVFEKNQTAIGGTYVTLHEIPVDARNSDYAHVGWSYNGIEYGTNAQFLMPNSDVVLSALWEYQITVESQAQSPDEGTSIHIFIVAILAIAAIVGMIITQMMRVKAASVE